MLEVLGIRLTEGNVRIVTENMVGRLDVNLNIEKVTKHDDQNVSLVFTYIVNYLPDVATVSVRGIAFCRANPAEIKTVMECWEKKKEVPSDICANAINMINANAAVNALLLTRPFGLMPHYMPPPAYIPEMAELQKHRAKPKKKKKEKQK